ncbi:tetratricopeptide (TPR) repeat protein [Catenuloplanes nepalensis]|uniref:Tetratricopeptide (TPR) repeat protein n=1 Tax=Catenuloplanes nepalensis TaxID=587533 RepID=A0ABT9MLL0_9ACTN|nr:tetratricopeptide repeat protein [Catenuloplanes nepalensis]MDP9792312.1 tetratricopeptide (TPR) repeat protein [Catenuloplanes nepalensis]
MPHAPLTAAVNRARAAQAAGDLVNGRAMLEEVLEDARRALGKSHDEVLDAALVLGELHAQADDPAAARRALESAYADGQLRLGDEDVRMLTLSAAIGAAAEELGNRHEAKRAYLRVARLGPGTVGPDHPMIARARAYLGDAAPPLPQNQATGVRAEPPTTQLGATPPVPPESPTMPLHRATPPVTPEPPTTQLGATPLVTPEPPTTRLGATPVVQPALPDPPTMPMHQSSAPPYQQSGPPFQSPHQSSAPPYQQSGPPYQQSVPPFQQSGPPAQQSSAPPYQQPYPQYPPATQQQYPGPPVHQQSGPPLQQQGYPVPPQHFDSGARPRRNRGLTISVAVAAIAAVIAAVVSVTVLISTRDDDGTAGTTPATTTAPNGPQVEGRPPADVVLTDDGEAIELTWTDPTSGTVSFIVAGGRAGEELKPMANLPPGRVRYEINGLNPDLDYCFTVVAVYGTDASQVAASEQRCTARNTPGGPTG